MIVRSNQKVKKKKKMFQRVVQRITLESNGVSIKSGRVNYKKYLETVSFIFKNVSILFRLYLLF